MNANGVRFDISVVLILMPNGLSTSTPHMPNPHRGNKTNQPFFLESTKVTIAMILRVAAYSPHSGCSRSRYLGVAIASASSAPWRTKSRTPAIPSIKNAQAINHANPRTGDSLALEESDKSALGSSGSIPSLSRVRSLPVQRRMPHPNRRTNHVTIIGRLDFGSSWIPAAIVSALPSANR